MKESPIGRNRVQRHGSNYHLRAAEVGICRGPGSGDIPWSLTLEWAEKSEKRIAEMDFDQMARLLLAPSEYGDDELCIALDISRRTLAAYTRPISRSS